MTYTLYMAVSNKLPPTSYIKLIDIWLIFGLTLPFCVFFLHVLLEHLPRRHEDPDKEAVLLKIREALEIIAKFVLPCLIFLFIVVYFTVAIVLYVS